MKSGSPIASKALIASSAFPSSWISRKEEDRLTPIFWLRNFSTKVLFECLELAASPAWNFRIDNLGKEAQETFACAWREESDIHWSRKKAGILAFLPGMDCFDYFDPRHGTSRFPWSFKLFFSSSFSVWGEDWGRHRETKKEVFFFNWSVDRPKFAFPLTDSSDCPFWPYRSSRSPRIEWKERRINLARKHHRTQSKNPFFWASIVYGLPTAFTYCRRRPVWYNQFKRNALLSCSQHIRCDIT